MGLGRKTGKGGVERHAAVQPSSTGLASSGALFRTPILMPVWALGRILCCIYPCLSGASGPGKDLAR